MAGSIEQRPWTPTVRTGRIAGRRPIRVRQLSSCPRSKVPDSKEGRTSYSFGHKLINRDETTGPGPAQYNVAGMRPKGKDHARAATLQSRPKELTSFVNPGPVNTTCCRPPRLSSMPRPNTLSAGSRQRQVPADTG
ncbi:outer dense fiber protein 3-like, partial [Drosophila novamexicana]|uniref:outer dense fiber protein 3-like n=1 Tax=Drosophila novamexicana TaxID=47314 RepID=UPI0011E5AF29